MSTEKKKEQQLLEELSAQPAARSSYSTAGLSSRREVENALAKAEYSPSQSVTDAAADLKNWQQNRPGQYESAYQGRIEDLIGQLLGRDSFQYSYAQDPLYRQYARQYTQNARNASADAAAQAAALTGGYGSSYAVSAAQQAYQQQMGALNDALPSLYRLALDTYNSEGDDVVTRIDQLNAQEQNAQARYNAELSDYYSQLDRKGSAYNAAYEQDYGRYQDYLGRLDTLYGYYSAQEQQARAKRQQAFSNVLSVLGVIGDAVQLAITGTTGIGSLMGSLANTGYNMYAKDRAYEAERADAAWSQQMQENQRQDSLAQQKYKNELAERQYQDTLRQQEFNNNVTSEKLNIAKGEWALKQSKAAQSAQQAAANGGKECGRLGRGAGDGFRWHGRALQRRTPLPSGQERHGHPERAAEGGLLQRRDPEYPEAAGKLRKRKKAAARNTEGCSGLRPWSGLGCSGAVYKVEEGSGLRVAAPGIHCTGRPTELPR